MAAPVPSPRPRLARYPSPLSPTCGKWEPPETGHFKLGPSVTNALSGSGRSVSEKVVIATWDTDVHVLEGTQGTIDLH
jgi:hypothetical protein